MNNVLCNELAGFYENFIGKGITPNIDLPDKDIMVIGDISSTKRVIDNLMINIVKHSNDYVNIKLSVEGENATLTIVNDSGNLTKRDIELMFDRFYRSDESRNSNNGNTGLGLSIVKNLMEKMNGSIKGEVKIIYYIYTAHGIGFYNFTNIMWIKEYLYNICRIISLNK